MNFKKFIQNLNKPQKEAVTTSSKNILILAGAGSGKTRVLIYRIAWLLLKKKISPKSIIAVTFTNKAVNEIKNRIKKLLGYDKKEMWIGTFHGLSYRILKTYYKEANLNKYFQIISQEEQLKLIKKIMCDLNINEKKYSYRHVINYINKQKNLGIRPKDILFNNSSEHVWYKIYNSYQKFCNISGLIDFSELILRIYELWKNKPYILKNYHKKFKYLLIDEFQDTNSIQYSWIKMISNKNTNTMIVGDDDQSIYGWRGARPDNINNIVKDFSKLKIIRLEQNYRSTNYIIQAANNLISNNKSRFKKKLWTNSNNGELISVYCASNEIEEAKFVANSIKNSKKSGKNLNNFAILYRKNLQSRIIEEILFKKKLSYNIYGGISFFDRKEIKDSSAYLRLIVNRNDNYAFERIINTPSRGIGKNTLNLIKKISNKYNLTFWDSSKIILSKKLILKKTFSSLYNFIKLINHLDKKTLNIPLHIKVKKIIKGSGLWDFYYKKNEIIGNEKIDNIKEFINSTYEYNYISDKIDPIQLFLSNSILNDINRDKKNSQDSIKLMTLHSAKGLEFKEVFIIGMEEGIFPSETFINKNENIEEERRLAYVGITRAMKKLTITYSIYRNVYGKKNFQKPSRFINELPKKYLKNINISYKKCVYLKNKKINIYNNEKNNKFKIGSKINHSIFGNGFLIQKENRGNNIYLKISFKEYGIKWILSTYVNILNF